MEENCELQAAAEGVKTDESASETGKKMLSRFYALQEERIQTYQLFEEGFQAYLRHAPNYHFPLYRQLVHEITQTFNKISQEILAIKARLDEGSDFKVVAAIIERIQDSEKHKLELTAKLQVCRQRQIDEPDDDSVQSEVEELKQGLKEIKDSLIELMEELKYESEELYTDNYDIEMTDSATHVDR